MTTKFLAIKCVTCKHNEEKPYEKCYQCVIEEKNNYEYVETDRKEVK